MAMVRVRNLLLVMAVLLFCACHMDSQTFLVRTLPFATPKSYISSGSQVDYVCWNNGDKVWLNGVVCDVDVRSTGTNVPYTASVTSSEVMMVNGAYYAYYPASSVNRQTSSSALFYFPSEESYRVLFNGKQLIQPPSAAYSTSTTLQFQNLATLLQIQLKSSASVVLERIAVSSDRNLSGPLSVACTNGVWECSTQTLNDTTYSLLNCGTLTTAPKTYYLVLPAIQGMSSFTMWVQLRTSDNILHTFYRNKYVVDQNLGAGVLYDFGTLTYDHLNQTLVDNQGVEYHHVVTRGGFSFDTDWLPGRNIDY